MKIKSDLAAYRATARALRAAADAHLARGDTRGETLCLERAGIAAAKADVISDRQLVDRFARRLLPYYERGAEVPADLHRQVEQWEVRRPHLLQHVREIIIARLTGEVTA